MATAERLGEVGGTPTALDPSSPHPRENEGVLLPSQTATDGQSATESIDVVGFLDLTDEKIPGRNDEAKVVEDLNLSHEVPEYTEIHGEVAVGLGTTHYKGYFPKQRTQDGIGYLFHGYLGFMKSSEPYGKALARAGLANIVVDQSHASESATEDLTDPQALHVATAEAVFRDLARNPEVVRKAPEGRKAIGERWVINAHSMGGLGSTRFVERHPDETEALVLLKTVGVNKSIILHIIKSALDGTVAGAVKHDLLPYLQSDDVDLDWKNVARLARYFGVGWPLLRDRRPTRVIGEGLSCLHADTRESLTRIGEQGTMRIGVEAGRDAIIEFAFDFKAYVDRHIVFDKYGHMMPQRRSDLTAEAVLSAREDLRFQNAA